MSRAIYILVEGAIGADIIDVANDMANLAVRLGVPVRCEANGAPLTVFPGEVPAGAVDEWQLLRKHLEMVRERDAKREALKPARRKQ